MTATRSWLVSGITIAHLAMALILAGGFAYLVWLARSEALRQPDMPEAAHGLAIGAAAVAPMALLLFGAAWGLWKNRRWGWWLALATDIVLLSVFVAGMVDDDEVQFDVLGFALAFLLFAIFLLLPRVRKFYRGGSKDDREQDFAPIAEAGRS